MEEKRKNSKIELGSNTEIDALIRLLEDPDEQVYENVSERLKFYGSEIVPVLENAWETHFEPEIQNRIEDIIHGIQFDDIKIQFQDYLDTEPDNLLKGALLLARYRYPDLDETEVLGQIEKIKRAIWLELNYDLTPFEQINVINRVFFGFHQFKAEHYNHFDPKAFFLPQMLEAKRGSSILLGILYMIIVQDLNIPVYGVPIPLNFSMAYCLGAIDEEEGAEQVQFYINLLNGGQMFSEKEINEYIKKVGLKQDSIHFRPIGNKKTVKLLLEHLKKSFEMDKAYPRIEEVDCLLKMFD